MFRIPVKTQEPLPTTQQRPLNQQIPKVLTINNGDPVIYPLGGYQWTILGGVINHFTGTTSIISIFPVNGSISAIIASLHLDMPTSAVYPLVTILKQAANIYLSFNANIPVSIQSNFGINFVGGANSSVTLYYLETKII